MKQLKYALIAASLALALPLFSHAAEATEKTAAATAPLVDGLVKKIDKEAGKITLKHGPIPNLDMPGMTMVFKASDIALLDRVKEGDKVRFAADRLGGALAVTKLEVAN
ncbi:copper-binding protein [Andreprevotia chitinilytica]|uniref:copper-binding protein n=1 Tax=Andreprevotia chitinilytica TaxID=396808 RepID=UPI00054FE200|nr:copper-binding protein [Andreprevotia chitinilytica]